MASWRSRRVLSRAWLASPVSLSWLPSRYCRRKGGQGQEEDKLPCFHIGGPWDTSAACSVTSQLQALVTEETEASCECLLSGRRQTSKHASVRNGLPR